VRRGIVAPIKKVGGKRSNKLEMISTAMFDPAE
jgi:hypothetical protein